MVAQSALGWRYDRKAQRLSKFAVVCASKNSKSFRLLQNSKYTGRYTVLDTKRFNCLKYTLYRLLYALSYRNDQVAVQLAGRVFTHFAECRMSTPDVKVHTALIMLNLLLRAELAQALLSTMLVCDPTPIRFAKAADYMSCVADNVDAARRVFQPVLSPILHSRAVVIPSQRVYVCVTEAYDKMATVFLCQQRAATRRAQRERANVGLRMTVKDACLTMLNADVMKMIASFILSGVLIDKMQQASSVADDLLKRMLKQALP